MTDLISKKAEEIYGIKADPSDVEKLCRHITERYGIINEDSIKIVFATGEAASLLTVNETYFFREPMHYEFLLSRLSLIDDSEINICSAATATGCEAYSIAMLLEAYNSSSSKPIRYHIDAFDIDRMAIETADNGFYGERSMREDGSTLRYMAFPWIKKHESGYQVDQLLKKNITFFLHNLLDTLSFEAYHIIFFRNAFIYLSARARPIVLSNLSSALKKDGLLFMGVSETAAVCHETLREKNTGDVFYFQKDGIPGTQSPGFLNQ